MKMLIDCFVVLVAIMFICFENNIFLNQFKVKCRKKSNYDLFREMYVYEEKERE